MAVQSFVLRSALFVGAAAVLAGCQGNIGSAGSLSATAHTTTPCTAANLALQLNPGGAAAGSTFPVLQFTNVGKTPCGMDGFPGVSFVGDDGHPVGAAATPTGQAGEPVTLTHGKTASAVLQVGNTQNFPPEDCNPVPVRGFQVFAPGDTTALFVPLDSADATACSSTMMPGGVQLFVSSVMPGSGETRG
jgi:hypothetical protein